MLGRKIWALALLSMLLVPSTGAVGTDHPPCENPERLDRDIDVAAGYQDVYVSDLTVLRNISQDAAVFGSITIENDENFRNIVEIEVSLYDSRNDRGFSVAEDDFVQIEAYSNRTVVFGDEFLIGVDGSPTWYWNVDVRNGAGGYEYRVQRGVCVDFGDFPLEGDDPFSWELTDIRDQTEFGVNQKEVYLVIDPQFTEQAFREVAERVISEMKSRHKICQVWFYIKPPGDGRFVQGVDWQTDDTSRCEGPDYSSHEFEFNVFPYPLLQLDWNATPGWTVKPGATLEVDASETRVRGSNATGSQVEFRYILDGEVQRGWARDPIFSWTPEVEANHTLELEARTGEGWTSRLQRNLTVAYLPPDLTIDPPEDSFPNPGDVISFGLGGVTDPDGEVEAVRVDWGDGEKTGWTPLSQSISHTYVQPGDYDVVIEARDDDGKVSSSTYTVQVLGETEELIINILTGLTLAALPIGGAFWWWKKRRGSRPPQNREAQSSASVPSEGVSFRPTAPRESPQLEDAYVEPVSEEEDSELGPP